MKWFFVISTFTLIAICYGADESPDELKVLTKLTPINGAQRLYSDNTRNEEDLVASANDRTFHVTKGYPGGYPGSIGGYPGSVGGYPIGGYPGRYPYGTGIIGSVYPGTSYRNNNLIPGGYQYTGPGGLTGGIGYGYYGNELYPGYSGYGGYGGYRGYGGVGDYGRGYPGGYGGYGNYGSYGGYGGYGGVTGYAGYGNGGYGRYDGYDGLGYGRGGYGRYDGYDGYGSPYGTNYGSTYAARSPYSPYSYRSDSYGTSLSNPSGYRGYS